MTLEINLNADVGESFGAWRMGNDEALLCIVGSANIACGFHAGDPVVMTRTVELAKAAGASIGAHPSFPDLQGFGRRRMELSPAELRAGVLYQLGALAGIASAQGAAMTHVKPHGALNNIACERRDVADTIVDAIAAFDPEQILLAPVLSELAAAGRAAGLRVADEVYADRAYAGDGTLLPRSRPGAVLDTAEQCIEHVMRMLGRGGIVSLEGKVLPVAFHSICVHGDSEHAVATGRALRERLSQAGYTLLPLPQLGALA